MAKRSIVSDDDRDWQLEEEEPIVLEDVLLTNLHPARLTVAGPVTGKRYFFNGAGAKVKVDRQDVDGLLSKRRGGCCGGDRVPYFELGE